MAAMIGALIQQNNMLVYRHYLRKRKVFRQRKDFLDGSYDDDELIKKFRFPRASILSMIDEYEQAGFGVTCGKSAAIPNSVRVCRPMGP